MVYEDILFEKAAHVAWVTINRPELYNAFRNQTVNELISAFRDAWIDPEIGVVVLTGAGEKAFCTGGDLGTKNATGYKASTPEEFLTRVSELHTVIKNIPKPVIAAVNGYAIGGGHVLHVLCDLTIAAETAKFGQAGPKVGSVDPGWGTAYLARVVGEKKAREIWYMCRVYTANQALEMGLVNKVVPLADLKNEVQAWCAELIEKSPTALALAKQSFNADTAAIQGIAHMGFTALDLFYGTEESREGLEAFTQKRKPNFENFRKRTKDS